MGIENLEKIIREQQRGKEDSQEFSIGEQLLDMARRSPLTAELLEQDLTVPEMGIKAAAAKLKEYSDKNHKGEKCFCINTETAEKILRDFYHLPPAEQRPERKAENGAAAPAVNLADYL